MTVLVLDGNENQAVAAVRSLARAGHRVLVGSDTRWSKAGWSRFAGGQFRYPSQQIDTAAFVKHIAQQAARCGGALIIPMTEQTTLPLSRDRAEIARAGGRLVLPPHDTVLRAFDKVATTRVAKALGIDVPNTVTVQCAADVEAHASTLRYPVVIKPRHSHEHTGGRVRATGAPLYARDAGQLRRAWDAIASRCHAALVQEFVEGTGAGYFALMNHGTLCAEFAHRRLRDVRPAGSGSSLRESIAPPHAVREASLKILRELNWHGVAMVEFRIRPDGTPTFLEVNGRFWNSLALAVHAGADFPALLAELAERSHVEPAGAFTPGVRCRWLLGDARHLVEVLRGAPAGFPGRWPSRVRTLIAVATPTRGTFHDNFAWRDPLPELGDWLHFAMRTLPRRTQPVNPSRALHVEGRPSHS